LRSSRWSVCVRVLFIALLVPAHSWAQTARITGTVTDESGAAAPKATVRANNVATGVERAIQTNDSGFYSIGELVPGVYNVTIEKDGFKTVRFANITLTVDQIVSLDTKLEIGAVQAVVEVNAPELPQVDTEAATLSNVIEHAQMTELPLILRDPYQLVLLGPGVTQSDSSLGGVSVNGGRERNNNFLLDGADNNDTDVPGGLGGITSQNPDSTQEFRVLTNNFAPEFGRNNGAIIDVITRSGTNDFHGDLFYFGRWDALGARDYFNHQIDPLTNEVAAKNPYVRNLYGGSIGGPIKKDRVFFFLNYQGDRFVTAVTNATTVPTAAFKSGVFTYTNSATGASQALNVTVPGAGNNGTGVGLDPVIQKIFALYPTPNSINPDGVSGEAFYPSTSREKDEDATGKFDFKLSKNNNLFVRYVYNWFSDPNPFHSDFLPGGIGAITEHARTQGLAIGLTSTLGSTFVNEFHADANRTHLPFGCNGASLFDSFGFTDQVGRGADFSLPVFVGQSPGNANFGFGCQGLGDSNGQDRKTGTYRYADSMSKVVGSHTLKWGGEFRDTYSNNFDDFASRDLFTFNVFSGSNIATLQNLNSGVDSTAIEDMVGGLLGLVNSQAQTQFFTAGGTRLTNDELNFREREVGVFWQDSWKVFSNLTLTYGLRWEYYGVPFEAHGNISSFFGDPSGFAPFTFTPVGPGTGRSLFKSYYRNFDPRFGFAWDPFKDSRTSVRGGIGVFSDRIYGNLVGDIRGNPPFQPSFFTTTTSNIGSTSGAQLQNQAAPGQLTPSAVVPDGSGIFPEIFSNNIRPPLIVSWNFGIQRQVTRDLSLEANYVGNHGTRILRVVNGNPPQPAQVAALLASGVPPQDLTGNNLYFVPADQAVNNNAFFQTFTVETSAHSWYDGLQLQVTERASHGLQIQGSYTWAHALDDAGSDPLPGAVTSGTSNFPVDSLNLRLEHGNSGFDTRQRGVINFIYQPNIGRGRGHLTKGVVGRTLEGWEIGGIAAWQTGLPYDIFGSVDTLHQGGFQTPFDRATLVTPSQLKVVPSTGKILPDSGGVFTGFNIAAFNNDLTNPPFGIPSNVGRNHWTGPGINNWNINLAKTTSIGEKVAFQLRFEFYNLFNRTQFATPNNQIANPLFGYSTSQIGQNDGTTGARQVQIGAKLTF
jgi:Carboxypeptidase regulatory-like domain/TonB dependent receptor